MAEESVETGLSARCKRWLNEAPFFMKILQLVMCVISIGLIVDPFHDRMQPNIDHAGLVYVALGGFIMIDTIVIICYLYGERLGPKTSLLFAAAGAVLCFATGVVLIYDWNHYEKNHVWAYLEQYLEQVLASGIFAILASIAFAIEIFLILREEKLFERQ